MAVKMTDPWVTNITAKGVHWDSVAIGLGLKVGAKGRKTWLMQLVWPGQTSQSKRTMGRYPGLSLADARKRAQEWYDLAKGGRDPKRIEAERREAAERERRETEAKANNTFGKIAESYIEGRTNRRADTDAREIRRSLIKTWDKTLIHTITPRDVRAHLGALAKRAPAEALNAWGHAVQIFKYAVHHEHIEVSPMPSLDKTLTLNGTRRNARRRTLNEDELAALWRAALARKYPEGDWIRWLMLTGCRRSEALGMRWRELHPELRKALRDGKGRWKKLSEAQRVWTIPGDRTGNKSDEERFVPLTDAMLELLATVSVRTGDDDLVFSHTGEFEIGSLSKLKFWVDKNMKGTLAKLAKERGEDAGELPGWVFHDLRRVVRSHLSALGVDFTVAELTVGHGKKGLQRVYDQHKYVDEMRAALKKWDEKLLRIVKPAGLPSSAG
jgi:integrase